MSQSSLIDEVEQASPGPLKVTLAAGWKGHSTTLAGNARTPRLLWYELLRQEAPLGYPSFLINGKIVVAGVV